jgi:catechol 2,3-dioxygenase
MKYSSAIAKIGIMTYKLPPATCIGHVHLKVSDIDRALLFYRDLLGFEVTQWYGSSAVFL